MAADDDEEEEKEVNEREEDTDKLILDVPQPPLPSMPLWVPQDPLQEVIATSPRNVRRRRSGKLKPDVTERYGVAVIFTLAFALSWLRLYYSISCDRSTLSLTPFDNSFDKFITA